MFQDDNLLDVLQLTVQLMAEHPASMVPNFDRKQGIRYKSHILCHTKVMCEIVNFDTT